MSLILSDRQVTKEGLLDWVNRQLTPVVRRIRSDLDSIVNLAGAAGGDLSGTYPDPTVAKINGTAVTAGPLATGAVLRATGPSSAAFGQVDLADTDAVVNVLPEANQADQTMGNEVSGPTSNAVIAKLQTVTLDPTAPTLAGQTIYYDGTKYVAGSNNVPYWRVQVANANTVALWQFDPNLGVGGLGDSGSNAITLSAVVGAARYIEGAPGISGIIIDANGIFGAANNAALNALTGALTISWVGTFVEMPAAGSIYQTVISYDGNAETQNTNYLFSASILSFAGQAGSQLDWFHEHGAGVNDEAKSVSCAPLYRPAFFTLTRSATSGGTCTIKFYINGLIIKTVTGITPTDTGGAPSQVLTIGGNGVRPTPTDQARMWLSTLHLESTELSAADILTRYNYVCRGIG